MSNTLLAMIRRDAAARNEGGPPLGGVVRRALPSGTDATPDVWRFQWADRPIFVNGKDSRPTKTPPGYSGWCGEASSLGLAEGLLRRRRAGGRDSGASARSARAAGLRA